MPENIYDAIVIGSGISGGWAAKELTQKILNPILRTIRVKPKNKIQQQIQYQLQKVRKHIENGITLMHLGTTLLEEQLVPENYVAWIVKHRKQQKKVQERVVGNPEAITLQLF